MAILAGSAVTIDRGCMARRTLIGRLGHKEFLMVHVVSAQNREKSATAYRKLYQAKAPWGRASLSKH